MNVWEIDVLSDLGTLHSPSEMGQWRLVASCCRVCSYAFTVYDPDRLYSDIILCICPKWWPTDEHGHCAYTWLFFPSLFIPWTLFVTHILKLGNELFHFSLIAKDIFFITAGPICWLVFQLIMRCTKSPCWPRLSIIAFLREKNTKMVFFFFIFLKNEI